MLLKGSLAEILNQLAPMVGQFPRFQPGSATNSSATASKASRSTVPRRW